MPATNPPSAPPTMPQIDFARAFASSAEFAPSPVDSVAFNQPQLADLEVAKRSLARFVPSSLSRASWTNITFVTLTAAGGLFCAFYFFNGAELLRSAAAWPREFLYSRPFAFVSKAKIDNTRGALTNPFGESKSSPDEKPFARSSRPLQSLAQSPIQNAPAPGNGNVTSPSTPPGTGTLPPPPGPGSSLGQLGLPIPGGDALMQTFNQAVANLQHATILNANRTVVVVKTAVSKTSKRARNTAKNAAQSAQNSLTSANGQLQSAQNSAVASSQAAGAQNQAANTVRSTTSFTQSALGGLRGGIGSTGLGAGGFGGGGVGGGGGLGGLSGVIHGALGREGRR
jgi:hypothetical protein